ncbi:hypothetical protein ABZ912_62115 [Nonomuraea angiospora]|uniref:hypothetical protein n=1 Tax=Nonomuraea angiospora TaxID=46172 RepID=UPI0033DD6D77
MRRVSALSALAVAGSLVLACAGPASAAPGFVRLYSSDGQVATVVDPEPFVCHRGFGDDTAVVNRTRDTILVYPDFDCRARIFDPVEPDENRYGNIGSFQALS